MSEPKIAIAILTCDRRQFGATENYADRTIACLRASGLWDQLAPGDAFGIFDAGPNGLDWAKQVCKGAERFGFGPHWQVWHGPKRTRLDLIRNTHRAFAWMLHEKCDYGIWLPDDVLCCKNWLAECKRWLADPDLPKDGVFYALVSRYPRTRFVENLARRWAHYPPEELYFSIGAMPAADIDYYLKSEIRQQMEERDVGNDWIGRDVAQAVGRPIYAHCPDLFADIPNAQSTIFHTTEPGVHDLMFPGEDYDALAGEPVEPWQDIQARWTAMEAARTA